MSITLNIRPFQIIFSTAKSAFFGWPPSLLIAFYAPSVRRQIARTGFFHFFRVSFFVVSHDRFPPIFSFGVLFSLLTLILGRPRPLVFSCAVSAFFGWPPSVRIAFYAPSVRRIRALTAQCRGSFFVVSHNRFPPVFIFRSSFAVWNPKSVYSIPYIFQYFQYDF